MKPLLLEEVVASIGGRVAGKSPVARISAVCTDSRALRCDDLFFALSGEHFDGHNFVDAALREGAAAAVISDLTRIPVNWHESGRLICVRDVVEALGRLAAYHRRQTAAQVVAVVGSNGKTTTKELIGAVLRSRRGGCVAPQSYNNAIGVPLTLLAAGGGDEFVVVEIGTNHPGEVAALAEMAGPDIGVVTGIGEEHLEFFDDLSGVAKEELSLLRHVRRRGFVATEIGCRRYTAGAARDDLTCLTFGLDAGADLRAGDLTFDGQRQHFKVNDRFPYSLGLMGTHNVSNALAAIAVGLRFGLTHEQIAAALEGVGPPAMRMERQRVGGLTLINDAYNANPASMRAALAGFEQLRDPGRRVLILGDMRELGPHALHYHGELGRAAGRSSAMVIVAVGSFARVVADGATATAGSSKRIYGFPNVETAGAGLDRVLSPGDLVLMKGSRAMALERLIPHLERCGQLPLASSSVGGRG